MGRPFEIAWEVAEVVINPVYAMTDRLGTKDHIAVINKVFRVQPRLVDLYAATSIVGEGRMFWVTAALLDVAPDGIFFSLRPVLFWLGAWIDTRASFNCSCDGFFFDFETSIIEHLSADVPRDLPPLSRFVVSDAFSIDSPIEVLFAPGSPTEVPALIAFVVVCAVHRHTWTEAWYGVKVLAKGSAVIAELIAHRNSSGTIIFVILVARVVASGFGVHPSVIVPVICDIH